MTKAREEFVAFVASRSDRMLRIAVLLTGDLRDAEDLLQSVMEKVYLRWSAGHKPTDLDGYVRSALFNGAKSAWRRRRSRPETLTANAPDVIADAVSGDTLLRSRLLEAVRELPLRQRAVVALRYFDDYSEADVARMLGCSVGTVKTHAHRGLKRLRDDPQLASYLHTVEEA